MLLRMNNFTTYQPEGKDPGLYLKDDQGRDWYEWSQTFQPQTLKVLFDDRGCITSLSYRGWDLNPVGSSVAEIPQILVPEGLRCDGSWFYHNGAVSQTAEGRGDFIRLVRSLLLTSTDVLVSVPDYTIADEPLSAIQYQQALACRMAWKRWPKEQDWTYLPHPPIPEWLLAEAVKHGFKVELLDDLQTL